MGVVADVADLGPCGTLNSSFLQTAENKPAGLHYLLYPVCMERGNAFIRVPGGVLGPAVPQHMVC